jgi:uncharacterized membrane protein YedE/YeeE
MKATIIGLLAGALFGVGLVVSGMTDPRNIVGFLDFAGHWNPNLAFVMAGAVGVHAALLFVTRRREQRAALTRAEAVEAAAPEPAASATVDQRGLDSSLVAGAAIFGVGWGLGGYCPGPALVALGFGDSTPYVFVIASLAGIVLADLRTKAPAHDAGHLEGEA